MSDHLMAQRLVMMALSYGIHVTGHYIYIILSKLQNFNKKSYPNPIPNPPLHPNPNPNPNVTLTLILTPTQT